MIKLKPLRREKTEVTFQMPFQKNMHLFVSVSYRFQIVKLLNSSLGQLASFLVK